MTMEFVEPGITGSIQVLAGLVNGALGSAGACPPLSNDAALSGTDFSTTEGSSVLGFGAPGTRYWL